MRFRLFPYISDWNLVEAKTVSGGDYVLTLERTIAWFRYQDVERKIYRGSCTVWHELPSYKRAGTLKESDLSCIWQRLENEKSDRKAGVRTEWRMPKVSAEGKAP